MVTLWHWVVPTWVQSPRANVDLLGEAPTSTMEGGRVVLHSRFADAFVRFVGKAAAAFGDLVDTWIVLNEPTTVMLSGYVAGAHPPGHSTDFAGARNAGLNLIIAHAAAFDALVASDTRDADSDGKATLIGSTVVAAEQRPRSDTEADQGAAKRLSYVVNDWLMNAWTRGDLDVNWDQDTVDASPGDGPIPEGTYAAQLGDRLQFIGVNFYGPVRAFACPGFAKLATGDGKALAQTLAAAANVVSDPGIPQSEGGTEIDASAFRNTLALFDRYSDGGKRPLDVLENGIGDCRDAQRSRYLVEHLAALGDGIAAGLPVAVYAHWSLTDNLEWQDGRSQCFGLYKVDYANGLARRETSAVALYRGVATTGVLDGAVRSSFAGGHYASDCTWITDEAERGRCVDALPANRLRGQQDLILAVCQ
jgi:beta-glucosidase